MPDADSTIRVHVVTDTNAKQLAGDLKKQDAAVSASARRMAGAVVAAGAVAAGVEFFGTALEEGDRLGDATFRIKEQLGDLSAQLVDTADDFTHLGQSAQDILELEAAFADAATAAGLADDRIADMADDAAATAAALSLITDLDADTAIGLIGKAAAGGIKALRELGIELTDDEVAARAMADTGKDTAEALTDQDLAAASYALVLEKLKPRLDEVAAGQGDVEQSSAELEAKWETLMGKIGEGVDGPLNDFLAWTIQGIEGWELFGDAMADVRPKLNNLFAPIRGLIDLLAILNPALGIAVNATLGDSPVPGAGARPGEGAGGGSGGNVNVYVQPRDAKSTESDVINALRDEARRNGEAHR